MKMEIIRWPLMIFISAQYENIKYVYSWSGVTIVLETQMNINVIKNIDVSNAIYFFLNVFSSLKMSR